MMKEVHLMRWMTTLQLRVLRAEATNVSTRKLDFVSNGVKFRDANAQNYNAKYVYMAFAKTPFKFANAR